MKVHPLGGCIAAALAVGFLGYSQTKQPTVLDGVYTEQQAQRGEEQYQAVCAACHEGAEPEANPPKGLEFIERWRDAPVSFLYNFIHTDMPGNKPGSLTEKNYVDLAAYLLQANGYRAGSSELTAAKTNGILLVGPDGPKPLPTDALVRAVGCLAAGSDGEWMLTSGAAPVRVRVGDQTTPEELAVSRAAAIGQASYKLINAEDFPVAKLKGQKVQAKGVLTKVANPYTLSVQSLEPAGDGCGK
jgi:S-disulfanyl-L-cysteine oxidoreductase SoxD